MHQFLEELEEPLPVLPDLAEEGSATHDNRTLEQFLVLPSPSTDDTISLSHKGDDWGKDFPSLPEEQKPDWTAYWRRDFIPCVNPELGCWRPKQTPVMPLSTAFHLLGEKQALGEGHL